MRDVYKILKKKLRDMPEFLTTNDLIKLGIYTHSYTAHYDRQRDIGPTFVEARGKYFYPKDKLVKYLQEYAAIHRKQWFKRVVYRIECNDPDSPIVSEKMLFVEQERPLLPWR